jgi:hypothetical protein
MTFLILRMLLHMRARMLLHMRARMLLHMRALHMRALLILRMLLHMRAHTAAERDTGGGASGVSMLTYADVC